MYRAHAVVLRVDPRGWEKVRPRQGSVDPQEEFRVVYVSDPLKIHPHIHDMYKGRRFWNVVEDRLIPSFVFNLIYLILSSYVLLKVYHFFIIEIYEKGKPMDKIPRSKIVVAPMIHFYPLKNNLRGHW